MSLRSCLIVLSLILLFFTLGGYAMAESENSTDRAPYYTAKTIKFMAMDTINPDAPMEEIEALLKEEAEHAWKLYESGVFRELYFRMDQPGVVVMLEAKNIKQARKVLDQLPLVQEGLVTFDTIVPLGPFVPFAELFDTQEED